MGPEIKSVLYASLLSFVAGILPLWLPGARKPLTDWGILFYVLMVIAVFLAAFLYFRATFPH